MRHTTRVVLGLPCQCVALTRQQGRRRVSAAPSPGVTELSAELHGWTVTQEGAIPVVPMTVYAICAKLALWRRDPHPRSPGPPLTSRNRALTGRVLLGRLGSGGDLACRACDCAATCMASGSGDELRQTTSRTARLHSGPTFRTGPTRTTTISSGGPRIWMCPARSRSCIAKGAGCGSVLRRA
jgi:hypothetical protein